MSGTSTASGITVSSNWSAASGNPSLASVLASTTVPRQHNRPTSLPRRGKLIDVLQTPSMPKPTALRLGPKRRAPRRQVQSDQ